MVKSRILKNLMIMVIIISFSELNAQDEVYLKIQSEGFKKINLVVAPFQSEGRTDLTEGIRAVMINNLTLSGFFQIFDESKNDRSSGNGDQNAAIQSGARVEGYFKYQDDEVQMNALLSELPAQRKIFNKKFDAPIRSSRFLAHQVSDEIVYYLIGEKGIATTKIAFVSEKGKAKEIAIIDYDGFGFQQLTSSNSLNVSPRWSPEGDKIAFTSYIMENPDLLILPLKDKKAYRLSNQQGLNTAPAWSPRGDRIAYVSRDDGQFHVYSINVNGEELVKLTDGAGNNENPCRSPDGLRLAFASNRDGRWDIYVMSWDGSQLRKVTLNGGNISPSWSPRLRTN